MKRILFCTGEGIGNVAQCIPVLRTISQFFVVDLWHAFGSYPLSPNFIPYVSRTYLGQQINQANPREYEGMVSTWWTRQHLRGFPVKMLAGLHPITTTESEVSTYMKIAKDLGIKEKDFKWYGECGYNPVKKGFDVVIVNGYNRHSNTWVVKGYPQYEAVAALLTNEGFTVCSLGSKEEYVVNTEDMTGLPLMDSLGVIKNSRLVISNDTGLYHCANALGTPNIALFTATSTVKNYDAKFHKYTTILTNPLKLDCQSTCQEKRRWVKDCKHWLCQEINPFIVAEEAKGLLTQ